MQRDSTTSTVKPTDRVNLRLPADVFAAIDASCAARAGRVSRNTWVAEAVREKLTRDRVEVVSLELQRRNG
ncbi:hypothetical protein CD944_05345 [Brevundimonas diminuta]|nr:hypothetical protein CD944_05345 [Brevundimonas diminuta]RSB46621.1 hypothetical protein EGK63_06575 [Brevundimonas sp. 357]